MNILITFRSITYAQKARSVLERGGIYTSLIKAPLALSADGCGYALRLRENRVMNAVQLLRAVQIDFRHVLEERPDGSYAERAL